MSRTITDTYIAAEVEAMDTDTLDTIRRLVQHKGKNTGGLGRVVEQDFAIVVDTVVHIRQIVLDDAGRLLFVTTTDTFTEDQFVAHVGPQGLLSLVSYLS